MGVWECASNYNIHLAKKRAEKSMYEQTEVNKERDHISCFWVCRSVCLSLRHSSHLVHVKHSGILSAWPISIRAEYFKRTTSHCDLTGQSPVFVNDLLVWLEMKWTLSWILSNSPLQRSSLPWALQKRTCSCSWVVNRAYTLKLPFKSPAWLM